MTPPSRPRPSHHRALLVSLALLVYCGPSQATGDRGLQASEVYENEAAELELLEEGNYINSTKFCFTDDCIQATAATLARAFPTAGKRSDWCLSKRRGPKNAGLILVKVPKAASSTSAGVALRIARRHKCSKVQWNHVPGRFYQHRAPGTFLFTSVRDPASRILSFVNFRDVSIGGIRYRTEEALLNRLRNFASGNYGTIKNGQGGFQLQFAALERIPRFSAWKPEEREWVQNPEGTHAVVQRMLEGYNFMLVVERMDESLVALALLLEIDVGDVLVTSSKLAGSYFYVKGERKCVAVIKSNITQAPAIQDYLQSDDCRAQNYGDYLLHAVVNRSLDLTIHRIGRDRFDTAMARYKALKERESQICAPKAIFPCSKEGKPQPSRAKSSCYDRDFGCGYKCIDNLVAKGLPESTTATTQKQEASTTMASSRSWNASAAVERMVQLMEYSSFA